MISAVVTAETAESFRVVEGRADAGIVLLCDHASNALPAELGTLGLQEHELRRHIAYDIGAEAITERLAKRLGAPAVLSRFSRLLIDINRGADDPTLIMRLSDGAVVPGNQCLSPEQRDARIARYWRPYHDAAGRVIAACRDAGPPPVIFSVHSMTHVWKGVQRPWQVSILWNEDSRLAGALLEAFRTNRHLTVGDNEPYHGGLEGDTLWQHARPYGLASVVIEYRQDLVADRRGQDHWADVTADILERIIPTARQPYQKSALPNGASYGEARSEDANRTGSGRVSSVSRTSARADRRTEHRPDEPGRVLPQLPEQLDAGSGG